MLRVSPYHHYIWHALTSTCAYANASASAVSLSAFFFILIAFPNDKYCSGILLVYFVNVNNNVMCRGPGPGLSVSVFGLQIAVHRAPLYKYFRAMLNVRLRLSPSHQVQTIFNIIKEGGGCSGTRTHHMANKWIFRICIKSETSSNPRQIQLIN